MTEPRRLPILRFYVDPNDRDAQIRECLSICEMCGYEEVSLFTVDYFRQTYLEDADFEELMKHLEVCADAIRGAGLIFSINPMHTLGHIRVPQKVVERFSFSRQLNVDGKWSVHPVLDPRCPNLRRHMCRVYKRYAELRPRLLFADDDFFVTKQTAYQMDRVREAAAILDCDPTREAFQCLLAGDRREEVKRLMLELAVRDLVEFARLLRESVHSVSPETRLGLMHRASHQYDIAPVLKALAGPHRPVSRPALGLFREDQPTHAYPQYFWSLSKWRAELGPDVDLHPECDHFPYDNFCKSARAMNAHLGSCFGRGEMSPAPNINSFAQTQPAGESRRIVEFLSQRRGQVDALAELFGNRRTPAGVGVWKQDRWNMEILGIPFDAARTPQVADIHFGTGLSGVADGELDEVLKRGVVLDIDAALCLEQRGRLAETGLCLGKPINRYDIGEIAFQRHDQPDRTEGWGAYYFLRDLPDEAICFQVGADGQEVGSWVHEVAGGAKLAPFALSWVAPSGARFGFINFSHSRWPVYSWMHPWMQPTLVQLLEHVRGRPMPVRINDRPKVVVECCDLPDRHGTLITILNYSTDAYADVELLLTGGGNLEEVDQDGIFHPVSVTRCDSSTVYSLVGPWPCLEARFFLWSGKRQTKSGRTDAT